MRESILSRVTEVDAHEELHLIPRWTSNDYPLGVRFHGTKLAVDGYDKLVAFLGLLGVFQPVKISNISWAQYQSLRSEFPWFVDRARTIEWTASDVVPGALVRMVVDIGSEPGFSEPVLQVSSKSPEDRTSTIRMTLHAKTSGTGNPLGESADGPRLETNTHDRGTFATADLLMSFSSAVTSIKLGNSLRVERLGLRKCTDLRSLTLDGTLPEGDLVTLPDLLTYLRVRTTKSEFLPVFNMRVCPAGLQHLDLTNCEIVGGFEHTPNLRHTRMLQVQLREDVVVLPQLQSLEIEVPSSTMFVLPLLLERLSVFSHWHNLTCDGAPVSSDRVMDLTPLRGLREFSWVGNRAGMVAADLVLNEHLQEIRLCGLELLQLTIPPLVRRVSLTKCLVDTLEYCESNQLEEVKMVKVQYEHIPHFPRHLKVFVFEDSQDTSPFNNGIQVSGHLRWLGPDHLDPLTPSPIEECHLSYLAAWSIFTYRDTSVRILKMTRQPGARGTPDLTCLRVDWKVHRGLEHLEMHQLSYLRLHPDFWHRIRDANCLRVLKIQGRTIILDFSHLPRSLEVLWIHGINHIFERCNSISELTRLRELVMNVTKYEMQGKLKLPYLLQDLSTTLPSTKFIWGDVSMYPRPTTHAFDKWVRSGWSKVSEMCQPNHILDDALVEVVDHLYPRPDPSRPLLPAIYADGKPRGFIGLYQNLSESRWRLPRLRTSLSNSPAWNQSHWP